MSPKLVPLWISTEVRFPPICDEARVRFARPRALSSEVNLLRESEDVVHFDAEITNCALQLAMSE